MMQVEEYYLIVGVIFIVVCYVIYKMNINRYIIKTKKGEEVEECRTFYGAKKRKRMLDEIYMEDLIIEKIK